VSNLTAVVDCAHGYRPAAMTQPEQAAATADRTVWGRHLQTPLRQFLRTETGSAAVLLAATIGALVWTNLDASSYDTVWQTEISLRLGGFGMSQDLHGWVNTGLMTFFFLVIGLEARREFDMGELRERRRFAIPLLTGLAALAAVFLARAGGVRQGVLYTGLGVVAWMAFFKSGVDPAVTGLVIGLATPAYPAARSDLEQAITRVRRFREQPTPEAARAASISLTASSATPGW
jgi:Na+/H+ antiporter NhaA